MSCTQVDLSVIIVNWNTRDLTAQCLRSLQSTIEHVSYEVWMVDNGSTDGSVAAVQESFPSVRLIANAENVGFVRANNQAIAACQGRYVLLLNSDAVALPGAVDELVRWMDEHPEAGAAGAQLLNADGSFQASFASFPTLWQEFLTLSGLGRALVRPAFPGFGPQVEKGPQAVDYVQGACLLVRHQAIEEVGGLDERIYMYAEEVDWCCRLGQAGWKVMYLPQVKIIHYGGQSSQKRRGRMEAELYRSRVYFFHKHHGRVAAWALQALIYAMTMPKMLVHGAIRVVTGGRRGRTVASWRELTQAMSGIDAQSRER
jgi:N-acetylglucosaminyl-diphospho-decaprenol L-rhamnosyltransferase